MEKYINAIRLLIEGGEIEDIQRDLELVKHYLKSTVDKGKGFSILKNGIKMKIPIPHIIGYTLVDSMKIRINKDVLHPGPETLTIIEKSVAHIQHSGIKSVLDLCTGSGSVAIAIARKCNVEVVATDISKDALSIAKLNALENYAKVEFLIGDLFEPLEGRKFNAIITNPPYVKRSSIHLLPSFIKNFAPTIAIDGGDDGLVFHKAILSKAKSFLTVPGYLFVECEDDQDGDVVKLCQQFKWNVEEKFPNKNGSIRGFMLSC